MTAVRNESSQFICISQNTFTFHVNSKVDAGWGVRKMEMLQHGKKSINPCAIKDILFSAAFTAFPLS
jgi:hypothetical protein